ncbi:MAG TPA: 50S ribosomal protein L30 [Candidatus Deferrimicrobium sp.]|nr:50S ribosomal protein L30 [Candidatus Deferrimicrobium sp.]
MASKAKHEEKTELPTKRLAVIRVRGSVGLRKPITETLQFLRLHRKNHLVLIDDRASYRGMLQKAKDYITWGEIGAEAIALLLQKRGRLRGGIRLTDTLVKKYTPYETIEKLAEAIANLSMELPESGKIKPVFRLHPPKGGFKGKIKRPVKDHGELGYRGSQIEDLIKKMA